MSYDTFPKEVATAKPDISILLRNNMKSFQLEVLPKVLFIRNKEMLAGTLRVLSTTRFKDGEVSQKGDSKENWRQIHLKGDDQVLRCLRFIPESTPFKLGVEAVQLRGGLRPPEAETSLLGKRTRDHFVAPQVPRSIFAPIPPLLTHPASADTSTPQGGSRGGPPKRGRAEICAPSGP